MQTTIRQSIAIAIQAKFNVPEFIILETFPDEKRIEIESSPDYEIIENIAMPVSDIEFDQVFYLSEGTFHYPTLFINDRYLLSGRQGGILPANLVTAFPGKVLKDRQIQALQRIIEPYSGYISISLSLIDGTLYFKNLQFGLLPDYTPHLQALHGEESPEWFYHNLEDHKLKEAKGMSASCRLYTYPYGEGNLQIVEQFAELDTTPLDTCYMTLRYTEKPNIKNLWRELYKPIQNPHYSHNGLVFNPDGGIKARKTHKSIKVYNYL